MQILPSEAVAAVGTDSGLQASVQTAAAAAERDVPKYTAEVVESRHSDEHSVSESLTSAEMAWT